MLSTVALSTARLVSTTRMYANASAEEQATMAPAIELSHHLSTVARSRGMSALKRLQKYTGKPGMINLAGGLPDPAYFPFDSVSGDALVPQSFPQTKPSELTLLQWIWSIFGGRSTEKTTRITIPKHAAQSGDVDLATTLQYAPSTGSKLLQDFIHEFAGKVFRPGYSDWSTLIHIGNTDGIYKSVCTLCDPGEMILVGEWTFSSALSCILPLGIKLASVKMDGQGLISADFERVLAEWDESVRGAKRPHVLYTIPIGQNPTGASMSIQRKKELYEICVKYDIIIIEDDPYFFLQEGTYVRKAERKSPAPQNSKDENDITRFINNLTPSFVRFDRQGRVIRLDTFSKVIAPGSRLGWFTCNPLFAERLERQAETSTAGPCGFSQALITQLVAKEWGFDKFLRWLQGLQTQYIIRRDFFVDCIFDEFELRPSSDPALVEVFGADLPVLTAYTKTKAAQDMQEKSTSKKALFSFVPPSAGMFLWFKLHHTGNSETSQEEPFEQKVWADLAEHGLLVAPGWVFAAARDPPAQPAKGSEVTFRLAFSMGKPEHLRAGVKLLAQVLGKYAPQ